MGDKQTSLLSAPRKALEQGQWAEALALCESIEVGRLAVEDRQTLGVLRGAALLAGGRAAEAVAAFDGVLAADSADARALNNRANARRALGEHSAALADYDEVLRRQPHHAEAHFNRSCVLSDLARPQEALEALDAAIASRPGFAEAHNNRGILLIAMGRTADALQSFENAIEARPTFVQALFNRGNALKDLGRFPQALESYDRALTIDPQSAAAHYNRGNALLAMGEAAAAIEAYDRAIACRETYAEAYANRSAALLSLMRWDEALDSVDRALALDPLNVEAHATRGQTLKGLARFEDSVRAYRQALQLSPDHAASRWNLSLTLLLIGQWAEGWMQYEWRWRAPDTGLRLPPMTQPAWRGEPFPKGTRILIYSEQGIGDTIQFIRYVRMLQGRGAVVIFGTPRKLWPLLMTVEGIDAWATDEHDTPAFDLHCPLLSLPLAFGTTLETIPADVPYLKADPLRVQHWAQRLGAHGLKVGICWQGSRNKVDAGRSFELRRFEALARIPGVRLISLHRGEGEDQLNELPPGMVVETLGEDFDREGGAFMDTAAVMLNCDVVITSDTAVAHLAGALGVPVWVALKRVPDWRWMLDRDDSPWYPTMRLFRQTTAGDWPSVFIRIECALRNWSHRDHACDSIDAATHVKDGMRALHQGDISAGEHACRLALQRDPMHADALQLLGVLAYRRARYVEALRHLDRALVVLPTSSSVWLSRGVVLKGMQRAEEAIASLSRACELDPANADAHFHLGNAHREAGRRLQALQAYDSALKLKPRDPNALCNRGVTLLELGYAQDAVDVLTMAVESDERQVDAHSNLGAAYQTLGRTHEAVFHLDRATALDPSHRQAWNNLGNAHRDSGRVLQALECYDRALSLAPDDADAHCNRSAALKELGRLDEALDHAEAALRTNPDLGEAHWNRSLILLLQARLADGWEAYEWRWRSSVLKAQWRPWGAPQLQVQAGSSLTGCTVLLHAEQGLGDTLQFCRYASRVKALGARVVLEVSRALMPLLQLGLDGVDHWVAKGEPLPAFDLHCPLLSLPLAFGTTLETIPADVPYLKADPLRVQQWAQRLGAHGLKVGICWQGSRNKVDAGRSFEVRRFEALARIPGIRLISLHRGEGEDQLNELPPGMVVETLGEDFDREGGAFMDTAAVMMNCDVVITSDTAVAHLAGALGVPVWVALKRVPDWRWMLDRDDSPWYPTMRLFRQTTHGDWDGVFERLAAALSGLPQRSSRTVDQPRASASRATRADGAPSIEEAVALHRQGRIDQAWAICQTLLERNPLSLEALCMSGAIELARGRLQEAEVWFDRAIAVEPRSTFAWTHRGSVWARRGQTAQALESFNTALRWQPDFVDALVARAELQRIAGQLNQALGDFERALGQRPDLVHARIGRELTQAALWRGRGGDVESRAALERVLALDPRHVEALNNLGACEIRAQRWDAALECLRRADELMPEAPEILSNLATALSGAGHTDEALERSDRVIEQRPDWADAYSNKASILCEARRFSEALEHADRALRLDPHHSGATLNRGVTLKAMGQVSEALAALAMARERAPDDPLVHWNLGVTQLLAGDLASGWHHYEWRLRGGPVTPHPQLRELPPWQGVEPLSGRTIVLHAEQGLGDTLQFCRYASRVKALGARVVLEVPRALMPLLQLGLEGVDHWVAKGEPLPAFDLHCPLLSLPLAFGTTLETMPADVPYLKADPLRVQHWAQRLGAHGLKVGICWQGSRNKVDVGRSFEVRRFEALARIPGVRLISLHRGEGEDQLNELPPGMVVETLGEDFDREGGAFMDTAAVMMNCDVVITSDTAVAHLAGALGVPVWMALKRVPDWRWMLDRDDSPWYPTMRLFRQTTDGDWDGVFRRVVDAAAPMVVGR